MEYQELTEAEKDEILAEDANTPYNEADYWPEEPVPEYVEQRDEKGCTGNCGCDCGRHYYRDNEVVKGYRAGDPIYVNVQLDVYQALGIAGYARLNGVKDVPLTITLDQEQI